MAVANIFNTIGRAQLLPERLFDAYIGVAGSSPAYGFIFIEALADAGVKYGLNRADALNFASQALLGAAEMVLSGGHPGALKDAVCSPGGTTIAAVAELEARGFRHAIIAAASACVEKSIKMSE
ncbi:MAG: pyrroline-5-carboxylate reductase, partial [Clostridiales bacterium]|jgi:pyrroline-5-carboxylate reductase|nr:pyrroline-5-carboxylate reductase [Clostridiales bacterium]